ncbi:uncharacterized protein LAJ45_00857 [Morchella importuna]|uniref:uncharacterized protein n=1 Tax=Morchella importuna TaxID=1174673 RepID=UPI001E8D6DF9|nr:uncharacterized protein LAJ45_00857 [Morchella importuna]KAH8155845.1 hypothetical protein LAJ45_00857 [Morchella importuna]
MTSASPASADTSSTPAAMATLLPSFRATLRAFTASPATAFQHIRSTTAAPLSAAKQLFVLDSSFNPPTKAHFRIALSAFNDSTATTTNTTAGSAAAAAAAEKRLLLLLATNNADKAPKPAPFDDRLAMMTLLSSEISALSSTCTSPTTPAAVDVALTKHARFLDKASALRSEYTGAHEFVFLTGFDTLVRIFDPRYYPEAEHRLDGLSAFFERGVVWCMFREGEGYGGRREQEAWLDGLRGGKLEGENDAGEVVSSTKVREAVKGGNGEVLEALLTKSVREYVLERGLYLDDGEGGAGFDH